MPVNKTGLGYNPLFIVWLQISTFSLMFAPECEDVTVCHFFGVLWPHAPDIFLANLTYDQVTQLYCFNYRDYIG